MTFGQIPDIEKIIVDLLNNDEDLEDLAGQNSASTEINPESILPKIRVSLAGGNAIISGWFYGFRIQIESWADTKELAFDIISKTNEILLSLLDGAQVNEGTVTGINQDIGLSWSPDPITKKPRYINGYTIYIHP